MYKLSDTLEVTHNGQTRIETDLEIWDNTGLVKKCGVVQITVYSENVGVLRDIESAIRRKINKIKFAD